VSIAGVSPWWRSWFVALLAQARPATAIATAVIVAAGLGLANLTVDFNIEKLFPRDDAKLTAFAEYTATFGRDDDIIVVLARVRQLDDPAAITALDRLARGLARLDLLAEVVTVLDVPHAWMADDMELAIGPMRQWLQLDGASGPVRADRWRALLASDTLDGPVIGNFLAPASSTVILMLRLAATHADNEGRMVATEKVRAWLRDHETPDLGRFVMSGMPVARADGMRMVQRDQARLLPLSLFVTLLVLGVLFGRWRDVALVLSHVVLTLIVTLGVMGHIGLRFSVISSIAPVILVTTGSAYSVQLLSRLRAVAGNGAPTLVADVFASMVGPLFLANFTTVAGFMSLFNGNLRLLNEFAGITAAGVFIAFILTITVFPLMVVGFPGAVVDRPPRAGTAVCGGCCCAAEC